MAKTTSTLEDRLSRIHRAMGEERLDAVDAVIADLEPAEIALLLESLPPAARVRLWQRVPTEVDGEVLLRVHDEVRGTLLEDMDHEEIVAAAAALDTTDLAEIFGDLPQQVAEDMLRSMDELQRTRLEETLSFEEDSTGRLMNMAGLDEEEDLFAAILPSARRRAVWLGINLVTAFLAAWVIGRFEDALDKIVALAVLMPIVASMGGIVIPLMFKRAGIDPALSGSVVLTTVTDVVVL